MKKFDYLIVGQGLAGTLLYWHLRKEGKTCLVVDAGKDTASLVAAGVINPMTGRNYVKSWMVDTLLPFAKLCYREMEEAFNIGVYFDLPVMRALSSVREENDWMARAADPAYESYAGDIVDGHHFAAYLKNAVKYGTTVGAARVDLPLLINAVRRHLTEANAFVGATLNNADLQKTPEGWVWQDYLCKEVIFCEGYKVVFNDAFNYLPFAPAKGNILRIKSSVNMPFNLRDEFFVTPLGGGNYWIGSGYRWGEWDTQLNDEDIQKMKNFAAQNLAFDFEEECKMAGIRPSTKSRRPLMGRHPQQAGWYIFNGLGTKGTSLGPFFAAAMAAYLTRGEALPPEVDISREQHSSVK